MTDISKNERSDAINENIRLLQRKNGLTFGSDAFLLSAFCRPQRSGRAADLGCGTGVIALLLAARGTYAHVTGVEVQETFAEITQKNIENNGFSHTVSVLCKDVRELSPTDFGGELDAVVANPPYMRADSGYASPHDEKQIARTEAIIQSMTKKEREHPEIINGSRKKRIALGSGQSIEEVNRLLSQFRQMQKMFKQMGGKKGGKRRRKMRYQMPKGFDPSQFGM